MDPHPIVKGFSPDAGLTRSALTRRGFLGAAGGAARARRRAAAAAVRAYRAPRPPAVTSGSGSGAIQFWTDHSDDEVLNFKKVIAAFNKEHPEITVNLLNIADAAKYYTKVNTAAVGGNLADVFYARTFDIASLAGQAADHLAASPRWIRTRQPSNPDDFWPAQVSQMSVDKQLYALPYDFSNLAIYINKSMFSASRRRDPDRRLDLGRLLRHRLSLRAEERQPADPVGSRLPDLRLVHDGRRSSRTVVTRSRRTSAKCVVNQPANVDFLTKLSDQMAKGVTPSPNATPAGVDPFAAGLVAMQVNGSWATAQTQMAVDNKFDWDVIRLPKGTTGKRAVSAAGGSWVIPPTSKNQVGRVDLRQVPGQQAVPAGADRRSIAQHSRSAVLGQGLSGAGQDHQRTAEVDRDLRAADAGGRGRLGVPEVLDRVRHDLGESDRDARRGR